MFCNKRLFNSLFACLVCLNKEKMPIGDLQSRADAPDTVTTGTNAFQSTRNQTSVVLSRPDSTQFTLMSITVKGADTYTFTITSPGQAPQVRTISYSSFSFETTGVSEE